MHARGGDTPGVLGTAVALHAARDEGVNLVFWGIHVHYSA